MQLTNSRAALALGVLAIAFAGCAPSESGAPADPQAAQAADDHAHDHAAHDHSGWWCAPHGVPEEVCGQCNSRLAAEFQRKGDWCAQHDRPDSQCFICHPEHEATFAARYEAKYGEQPPKPQG